MCEPCGECERCDAVAALEAENAELNRRATAAVNLCRLWSGQGDPRGFAELVVKHLTPTADGGE
jgi:hypothetical protein